MDRTVFRLRQLPVSVDRFDVAKLLHEALAIRESAIQVFSLAQSVDIWVLSKTATLMFEDSVEVKEALRGGKGSNVTKSGNDEWRIRLNNIQPPIILDLHFRGLTPLYEPANHIADCIAISGLASHPFGSWQPKGQSKTFMWIRDALPKTLPHIRPILYGYDTTLVDSKSFQSITDLALGLLNQLKARGWTSPSTKPLIFLAHSLGGLVLKQAFVSLAGHDDLDHPLRLAIRGAIFFGVPNFGMEQSSLLTMVKGQANEGLVEDLAVDSEYLTHLDEQFSGLSQLHSMLLYWGYETQKSKTVQENEAGKWLREGPEMILVTPRSATRRIYGPDSKADEVFPIDEDHSNMVKFAEDDIVYSVVAHKLSSIYQQAQSQKFQSHTEAYSMLGENSYKNEYRFHTSSESERMEKVAEIIKSLGAPEQDLRFKKIEERFEGTFDWVYDLEEPGFTYWLRQGSGLFWINGKPGSGKSTLMKFISQDPRTLKLLSNWKLSDSHICASFFFHHRGSSLQKSFEGLLRSILYQMISTNPNLSSEIYPLIDEMNPSQTVWTRIKLQTAFSNILKHTSPLHLTLFLDALDEYDGPKEFICDFLKDLAQIPLSPTKNVRICFSSRPWEIFNSSFRHCPSLSVQDFTTEDIRTFCLGSIEPKHTTEISFKDLISNIVARSRGVFLWVTLIVKDLHHHIQTEGTRTEGIQKYLDSLPTELDQYYTEIIARIPSSHSWKTYVMLEIVARSYGQLDVKSFYSAAECAELTTYDDIRGKIQVIESSQFDWHNFIQSIATKYCGGLVEVFEDEHYLNIQPLHQTVKDFVTSPGFKQIVLDSRAKITIENGFTFLARYGLTKCYLLNPMPSSHIILNTPLYANASERTTGHSIREFLDSHQPWHIQSGMSGGLSDYLSYKIFTNRSSLSIAICCCLDLYISETVKSDPNIFINCTKPLFTQSHVLNRMFTSDQVFKTGQLVLQNGYTIRHEPEAFSAVIYHICFDSETSRCYVPGSNPDKRDRFRFLLNMAVHLLDNAGASPIIHFKYKGSSSRKRYPTLTSLHASPPQLARILLDRGADVNTLDLRGNTPLDHICRRECFRAEYLPGFGPILYRGYELICLFVERGGKLHRARGQNFEKLFNYYEAHNWPVENLRSTLLTPNSFQQALHSKMLKVLVSISRSYFDKEVTTNVGIQTCGWMDYEGHLGNYTRRLKTKEGRKKAVNRLIPRPFR